MKVISSVGEMQEWADGARTEGRRIALVPTMGALHEGHLTLVRAAHDRSDDVIVSIFVNPTQFAPGEDFEQYPRDLDADAAQLSSVSSDVLIFNPTIAEMYPGGPDENRTWVAVDELDFHLCGRHRPGHFKGVSTVVMKLLHACKPHVAIFGLKDAQQFVILKRMARETLLDVEIVGEATVREVDGLAHSSRNVYLSPEQRASAVVLSQAVLSAQRQILQGEQHSRALVESMRSTMEAADGIRVQYAEVVDAHSLQPVETISAGQEVLAAVAAYFGTTRLIDNVFVRVPSPL